MQWDVGRKIPTNKHNANYSRNNPILWHRHLCHLSYNVTKQLEGMVDRFSMDVQSAGSCNLFQKEKAVQQSFKTSTQPPAKYLLDIIHMDIIVINIESNKGEIAVLVCTDNHSGYKFCFPLKLHAGKEILKIFLKWMLWAERITH